MGNRAFNFVVVLFWLATMTWLVVEKVLPPLFVGEPPNYRSILKRGPTKAPVCWRIQWNDRPVGWVASTVIRRDDGMTLMRSRVFFGQLPLDDMAPGWLGAIFKQVLRNSGKLDMDARSTLEIDPLGRPVGFESRVRLANMPDVIKMQGQIDGTQLKLSVQSGDYLYKTEKYLPPDALVGDALSPQAELPGLRMGQTWTMPVYSPFRPPNSPLEIQQARVERHDMLSWEGKSVDCLLVVYRADAGSGLLSSREPRGKLWVRPDGRVIQQEATLFNSQMQFVRLGEQESRELIKSIDPEHGDAFVPPPRQRPPAAPGWEWRRHLRKALTPPTVSETEESSSAP